MKGAVLKTNINVNRLKVYKYPDEHKESNEDMDAKSEKNEGTDARSEENEGADAKREENGRKGGSNKDNGKESASNEENGKEANGVSDMSKKRSVLLGSKAYQTLASLVAPETPGAKLYEELVRERERRDVISVSGGTTPLVYIDGVLITMELDTLELPYPLFQNQRLGASSVRLQDLYHRWLPYSLGVGLPDRGQDYTLIMQALWKDRFKVLKRPNKEEGPPKDLDISGSCLQLYSDFRSGSTEKHFKIKDLLLTLHGVIMGERNGLAENQLDIEEFTGPIELGTPSPNLRRIGDPRPQNYGELGIPVPKSPENWGPLRRIRDCGNSNTQRIIPIPNQYTLK
ncbi:hypothetical protein EMCRGX_G027149 [Ephydatia muelleri]